MPSKYQVYNLVETYPELGKYSFKVVLNPRNFKSAHGFEVHMHDSDGTPMPCDVQIWGRKINVTFQITPSTADGVSTIRIKRGKENLAQLMYWVIKP